jgi:hypothetical protein
MGRVNARHINQVELLDASLAKGQLERLQLVFVTADTLGEKRLGGDERAW